MRVAVVGAGVSGIAAAKTLKQLGHEVTLFERGPRLGGVWAHAYAGVRLQIPHELYAFSDFPWPVAADTYPPAGDVLRYLEAAVAHFGLDIRFDHTVRTLTEQPEGWRLTLDTPEGATALDAGLVLVAAGQFTHEKARLALPGQAAFAGRILGEHEVGDPALFDGQRVAVVGFGKSAVDMVSFALGRASEVHHIFRAARWLMPRTLFGQSSARLSTQRLSTAFARSWVYPSALQRRSVARDPRLAARNEAVSGWLVRRRLGLGGGRAAAARARLAAVDPMHGLHAQFRGTLAPDAYFPAVARGAVQPHRAAVAGFSGQAVLLADGSEVVADIVVTAIGYERPTLPFLPAPVAAEFAASPDGVQLYRHLVHPGLRRLGFVGFAHNPLHIASVEIGTIWLDAVARGDLVLPPAAAMAASAARVAAWKRAHTIAEPARAYSVGAHLHNYLDVLLMELGLRHRRKRTGLGEWFGSYGAADFATLVAEYEARRGTPRAALDFDT